MKESNFLNKFAKYADKAVFALLVISLLTGFSYALFNTSIEIYRFFNWLTGVALLVYYIATSRVGGLKTSKK